MKERPILFSAPMVRALLAGTKTQTRRVLKPQPEPCDHELWATQERKPIPTEFFDTGGGEWACRTCGNGTHIDGAIRCPYGVPGDRLWVRERHCFLDVTKSALSKFPLGPQNGNAVGPDVWNVTVEYSDGTQHETSVEGDRPKKTRERGEIGWRPSIFMPRWASRITLEVVNVRVERLQEISEADCYAEGIQRPVASAIGSERCAYDNARNSYLALWESINGKGSWTENPWVWIVEFKRLPA